MKTETLFICEICGQSYVQKEEALQCESNGIPSHKYAVNELIVMPLRYPDEDGYFGVSLVKSLLVSKKHKPLYELENLIQTGKNFWSGSADIEKNGGFFGDESSAPAEESQMYRVGDKYNYTHLGVKYDTILIENCLI